MDEGDVQQPRCAGGRAAEELEADRDDYVALQEEGSRLLEQQQQKAREQAEKTAAAAKPSAAGPEASAVVLALQEEISRQRTLIGIINRASWCQVTTFKSSHVVLLVHLSARIAVEVSVDLSAPDADDLDGVIANISRCTATLVQSEAATDNASELARAFYAEMLASEVRQGALSSAALASYTSLGQIPELMSRLNGHVSSLRNMLCWLGPYSVDGHAWNVCTTTTQAGRSSSEVVVTLPDALHELRLPMPVLAAGDISGLSSSSLRVRASGDSVCARPMAQTIKALSARHTAFHGFPSSALRQRLEAIVLDSPVTTAIVDVDVDVGEASVSEEEGSAPVEKVGDAHEPKPSSSPSES